MPEYRITTQSTDEKIASGIMGGAFALLFAGGAMAARGVKNKQNEMLWDNLWKNKPAYYFSHRIVGVTCPSCLSVTEEGQWDCYMCGSEL